MNTYEMLKYNHLALRKDKNQFADFIGYVIGEIENKVRGERTDDKVIPIVKNIHKKLGELGTERAIVESKLLEAHIPKQLTEFEIRSIMSESGCDTVGGKMAYMKTHYANQYDGKIAAKVAKEG